MNMKMKKIKKTKKRKRRMKKKRRRDESQPQDFVFNHSFVHHFLSYLWRQFSRGSLGFKMADDLQNLLLVLLLHSTFWFDRIVQLRDIMYIDLCSQCNICMYVCIPHRYFQTAY